MLGIPQQNLFQCLNLTKGGLRIATNLKYGLFKIFSYEFEPENKPEKTFHVFLDNNVTKYHRCKYK